MNKNRRWTTQKTTLLHTAFRIPSCFLRKYHAKITDSGAESCALLDAATICVCSTPTTGIRSSLESNDSGLLFFFQKTLHRNRLGTLYCHEGDWSWIYFFNGQCTDAAGTALWQWLGQQRR